MSKSLLVGVIGANGFIGSRLVEWLVLHDLANVRPIVRTFKGMARLARFDLDCRMADATDQVALERQLKGCDVLFHCVVGRRVTILKSAKTAYQACAGAKVHRLVYLSSGVVHGHDPIPGTDDDSKLVNKQQFEYNVSKVMAERLLRRLRADGAVEVVTLRPCIVFGPRSMWWSAQIATDLLSRKAYLVDGGKGVCNTVYVDNLVQAMWQAAISKHAANQDFIITDGEQVTWWELYSAVAAAVGEDIANVRRIESTALSKNCNEQKHLPLVKRGKLFAKLCLPPIAVKIAIKILRTRAMKSIKQVIRKPNTLDLQITGANNVIKHLPAVDPEISSLQCCRYMLPIDKARKLLGYEPQVTFSEGCRRTKEWIRFAFGIDVIKPSNPPVPSITA